MRSPANHAVHVSALLTLLLLGDFEAHCDSVDALDHSALQDIVHHVLLNDTLLVVCSGFVIVDAGGVPRSVAILVTAQ